MTRPCGAQVDRATLRLVVATTAGMSPRNRLLLFGEHWCDQRALQRVLKFDALPGGRCFFTFRARSDHSGIRIGIRLIADDELDGSAAERVPHETRMLFPQYDRKRIRQSHKGASQRWSRQRNVLLAPV